MKGISLEYDSDTQLLTLLARPNDMQSEITIDDVKALIEEAHYEALFLSAETLKSTCDKANLYYKTGDTSPISAVIAELRHAEVSFKISNDNLTASLILTAPYGGRLPTATNIRNLAHKARIKRGLGMRHIQKILEEASLAEPGKIFERIIAKGLPPRNGRNSRFIPLVPNALERILKPQTDDSDKTDLRNLGDVICVKKGAPVVRRTPPTEGRAGFDVRGSVLVPTPGEWLEFKMGKNTEISPEDENILISTLSGMPKYRELVMNIDDTFICNGVNVGSGHVTYDGAILVNGDVAEKMIVKATKDITINGFVESATIEAGGDIIITEGAMGKVTDNENGYACTLIAGGNIHVQHGQGLDIKAQENISVGRQMAYSRLKAGGSITVGRAPRPMGNLFACEIACRNKVEAGTLGAISGSTLKIDFSEGLREIEEKQMAIKEMLDQLRQNNTRHKEQLDIINNRICHKELASKVAEAKALFNNETALLNWLEVKALDLKRRKEEYLNRISLIANKRLYAGVSAKLNSRNWRSDKEFDRCVISYANHKWIYEPQV